MATYITESINKVDWTGHKAKFYGSGGQQVLPESTVQKMTHDQDEDAFILVCSQEGGTHRYILPKPIWSGIEVVGKTFTLQRISPNQEVGNRETLSIEVFRVVLSDPLNS